MSDCYEEDLCGCSCYLELILVVWLLSCLCRGGVLSE
ncbi:hypothetical protein JOC26_000919 [Sporohalobacter salinus]|nr:hypothetical protein [Sporohalobacter salinus]